MNICVIPARGGSKRIPKKNIKEFNGKPIIAYSIEAAINCNCFEQVIVSTDDNEIKTIALEHGAEVPFLRPKEFSEDNSTSEIALKHAVNWLKKNENYEADIIVYLHATSIFRTKNTTMESAR